MGLQHFPAGTQVNIITTFHLFHPIQMLYFKPSVHLTLLLGYCHISPLRSPSPIHLVKVPLTCLCDYINHVEACQSSQWPSTDHLPFYQLSELTSVSRISSMNICYVDAHCMGICILRQIQIPAFTVLFSIKMWLVHLQESSWLWAHKCSGQYSTVHLCRLWSAVKGCSELQNKDSKPTFLDSIPDFPTGLESQVIYFILHASIL